jgi:hypothetical protein
MYQRILCGLLLFGAGLCFGQITDDQKIADLRQLSSLYAKQYGPYEWKRDTQGFDLLNLKPWLDRALATKNDIDYLDLLVEYVSSLNDAHDLFYYPFTYTASLGFSVDLYDGKPLIDGISRSRLPFSTYPFVIGDELVSVDGLSAEDWIKKLWKYSIAANPRSTTRTALSQITSRTQQRIPWAYQIGDTAEVVVRRASGDLETYQVPWVKAGQEVTEIGPVTSPSETETRLRALKRNAITTFLRSEDSLQPWQEPLAYLMNASLPETTQAVLGVGATKPVFALPEGFSTRMAGNSIDSYTSGSWMFAGKCIGYLRIPTMSPTQGTSTALYQLDREIAWMEANTDALVVDIMRNPGGSVLYVEQVAQRLIPYSFRSIGFELRATASDVASFGATVKLAKAYGLSDSEVAGYQGIYDEVLAAYRHNRGRTAPISLTRDTLNLEPASVTYSKPMVLLVDEFSASGGDALAATLQDAGRVLVVGYRTMGAGGNVTDWDATSYTEGMTRVTRSLMSRKTDVITSDFPAAPYVENIGVRPDIELDYMTRDNLMNSGLAFITSVGFATVDYIKSKTQ